jgi:protein-S-isoprenylcysteine O-methyltransferase Ste14
MSFPDLSSFIRFVAGIVMILQVVGALVTFTPMRERRIGLGSLFAVGFLLVLVGGRRSPLFLPALIPGVLGLAAAVALFVWARLTIHGLLFSYMNSTDVPQFVCSRGPYHWVRHPFYTSYLLSALAMTLMFPTPVTMAGSILVILALNSAAGFEEGKFKDSPVAEEYVAYTRRTGRFVPRFLRSWP